MKGWSRGGGASLYLYIHIHIKVHARRDNELPKLDDGADIALAGGSGNKLTTATALELFLV